jgi:release factor glutamine methyltransferase
MEKRKYPSDHYVQHVTAFLCKVHKFGFFSRTVKYKKWQFFVPPGIFKASLSESLQLYELTFQESPRLRGDRALDMGCGCGPISVLMASMGWNVMAVDLSSKAIDSALYNAKINNVKLDARLGDLFSSIKKNEKFDLITFNIPYFCCNSEQFPHLTEIERSWFWREQDLINFFTAAKDYLLPKGQIVIFTSSYADFNPHNLKYISSKVGLEFVKQVELPNSWILPTIRDWPEMIVNEVLTACFFTCVS